MPLARHDSRRRSDQTARWAVTGARRTRPRRTGQPTRFLVIAGCLGLALGVGLGPMVGALGDAVEVFDPHEPITFLSTAARRQREFQFRVRDFRVSELIDAIKGAYCPRSPRG